MNKLKELRKSKNLTQQELATETKIPYRTIQRWENGESNIKPEKAFQLADFFEVSVGYLLGYSEQSETPFENSIPTPREFSSWKEFDYMQLVKTDLDFWTYEELRKKLDPLLVELIINYSFCDDARRDLLREIAKKFAEGDAVSLLHSEK